MMSVSKNELERAAREYVETVDAYRKLVNDCVSVFGTGETSFKPKILTRENLDELREAEAKVTEARKKWHNLIRLYKGFSDS
jgi:hypothetical protein